MSEYAGRAGYICRVAAFFGVGELEFQLTRGERRRLIFASFLPAAMIFCEAILFALQGFKNIPHFDFTGLDFNTDFTGFWWRFSGFPVSGTLSIFSPS